MHEAELGSLTPRQVVPMMASMPTRNAVVVANVVVFVSSCFLDYFKGGAIISLLKIIEPMVPTLAHN